MLNNQGQAIGTLTLDAVVDEVFGHRDEWISFGEYVPGKGKVFVDRSFPGDTLVSEVNKWFSIEIPGEERTTLEDLMGKTLVIALTEGMLFVLVIMSFLSKRPPLLQAALFSSAL